MYIYQLPGWPHVTWDEPIISSILVTLRHNQGRFVGGMEKLGFSLRSEAVLETMTLEVIKSNEIEGEILDALQVRSSIARRLGIEIAGLIPSDRNVDGVVEMTLNATQNFQDELTEERLFGWHASLFPAGRSGIQKITTGAWRTGVHGAMQVVSGPLGREKVHFEAPDAQLLTQEMAAFLQWFNAPSGIDAVLKAALAHLWFVTIHPFDDGNGRIARTIAEMQLTRSDSIPQRFYSMSAQIRIERNAYYDILEKTQKGSLDITKWLEWFLACLDRAISASATVLERILKKARIWNLLSEKQFNSRQQLIINKLLDRFEGKLTSSKWAKISKCSQDTALRDIQNLIEQGVLMKEDGGGRSTSYLLAIH